MDVQVDACADTGGFSLVYKQNTPDFQPYFDSYLFVAGKSMTLYKGRELPEPKPGKEKRANICGPWSKQQRARIAPSISYARESRTSTLLTTWIQHDALWPIDGDVLLIGTMGAIRKCQEIPSISEDANPIAAILKLLSNLEDITA